jgi:hypothetical protein
VFADRWCLVSSEQERVLLAQRWVYGFVETIGRWRDTIGIRFDPTKRNLDLRRRCAIVRHSPAKSE